MNRDKDNLHKTPELMRIEKVPEKINLINHPKLKKRKINFRDFSNASMSSTEFWNNEIDEEVW